MREWFETRLLLPFLPLGFDVLIRWLALDALQWWQIPDLKTLSITTCFFCLLLAMDLKGAGKLPSDDEHHQLISRLRKRFLTQGQFSAIIFGASAAIDVADRYYGKEELAILLFPYFVVIVLIMLTVSMADAIFANLAYKLSYNV